jgi:hypothetical protein
MNAELTARTAFIATKTAFNAFADAYNSSNSFFTCDEGKKAIDAEFLVRKAELDAAEQVWFAAARNGCPIAYAAMIAP